MLWCGNCNPTELILAPERIRIIYGYVEALLHAANYCSGRKGDINHLIRRLARAKGLPERVGEKEIQEFFAIHPQHMS